MKNAAKLKQFLSDWRGVLSIAPSVASFIIAMRVLGLFQLLEWAALDRWFNLRPPEPPEKRVVIVTIDENTIRSIGQWPIPDTAIAKVLEKINQQKPRAIGMDLYRDLPVQPGYEALLKVMKSTPNLIGVQKVVGDRSGLAVNPPPALAKVNQVAASDLILDIDGKVRRGLLTLETPSNQYVLGLGAKLALMYLEAEKIQLQETDPAQRQYQLGRAKFTPFRENDGGYVRADNGGYQIGLNFRGTPDRFPSYSMMQVLNGQVPPNWGRDRIVLIGATAASLHDDFFTPYSGRFSAFPERMPGVFIHANISSQMIGAALDGRPQIQVWGEPLEWLWILVWSCIGAILSWKMRSEKLLQQNTSLAGMVLSVLLAGTILVTSSYLAFLQGWWIPVVPPLFAHLGAAAAIAGYIAILERQDRGTVMTLFRQQVTPQVADEIWLSRHQLLQGRSLVGREMTATVLFSDLEGFSTIATRMAPAALMAWLNEYMSAMAQAVLEHNGVVNKFIGDAVMALFGVPIQRTREEEIAADAQNAVACALAMAERVRSLNQQWYLEGRPTVAIRVGIATGTLVTGSLGSTQRLEYTAIGDTVNIAARLESYDKSLNGGICRILICEETYRHIKDKFSAQFIGSVFLKGRDRETKIYQVLLPER